MLVLKWQFLNNLGSNVTICDKDSDALKNFSQNNPEIFCHQADVSKESGNYIFKEIEKNIKLLMF